MSGPFTNFLPTVLDRRPFTTEQARECGVTKAQLHDLVSTGVLRRLMRGIYVRGEVPDSVPLRAEALRLVVPERCFVTDRTAAWLHGAPYALAPGEHLRVHIPTVFDPVRGSRLRNDLCASGSRDVRSEDLTEVHGLLVTTPLRTALDLGRNLHRAQALAALDQLLRLGAFTHDELLMSIERFKGFRGVRQLRWLAPLADPGAESPGESALRLKFLDAGLPRPQTQIEAEVDGHVFRIDLGLPDHAFGAEYDGAEWHSSEPDVARDEWRRGLLRGAGWQLHAFNGPSVFGRRADADIVLRQAFGRQVAA